MTTPSDIARAGWPNDAHAALRHMHALAQKAFTDVAVDFDDYARFVGARITCEGEAIAPALAALHGNDLYLACACAAGNPAALRQFETLYKSLIAHQARALDQTADFAAEVAQRLSHRLFIDADGAGPRIGTYAGRGALAAWVSVAAQRVALGLKESEGAQHRARERAVEDKLAAELDPELAYMKSRYAPVVAEAFRQAFARLPDRQRTLLRLQTAERLSGERIAPLYGVSPATISRWLDAAREAVRSGVEAHLRAELRMGAAELDSLTRLVASQVDVSLSRLLVGAPSLKVERE